MASRPGTVREPVACRLVQGRASPRPASSGRAGAQHDRVPGGQGHRLAVRGGHGDPAVAVQPAVPADQFGAETFQPGGLPPVVPAGHPSVATGEATGASTAPVTAWRAPATLRASATATTGRSIALLGMQAQ